MRIAILGTGLIGTSIGLGLRNRVPDVHVVGYDRSRNTSEEAKKRGGLDEVALSASDAVRDARLVVIAVPILAIRPLMEEIREALPADAIVTDTGSSKAEIMRWARDLLPGHAGFVASHPMAGKTEFGPAAADEALFEGARWVIVPSVQASEDAIRIVTNMAESLGATPMVMDAEEHDAYVAAISHMPMVAATALFSLGRSSEAWPELSLLAAGGFKDMTRLAATDPDMAYDIAVTNRENIAHWIERYVGALLEFRRRLLDVEADDDLYKILAATEIDYREYRNGKVGREEKGKVQVEGPSFTDFLAGGWLRERFDKAMGESEDRVRKAEDERRTRRQF